MIIHAHNAEEKTLTITLNVDVEVTKDEKSYDLEVTVKHERIEDMGYVHNSAYITTHCGEMGLILTEDEINQIKEAAIAKAEQISDIS